MERRSELEETPEVGDRALIPSTWNLSPIWPVGLSQGRNLARDKLAELCPF